MLGNSHARFLWESRLATALAYQAKSGLLDKIADRHLKEMGIYMAVELAYSDYGQYVKDNMSPLMLEAAIILEEMKPLLIDAIIRASKEVKSER